MIPKHSFLEQICSCKLPVLPQNFYDKVKQGSLILENFQTFSFCKDGLRIVINDDENVTTVEADIVIFATGYKSDQKFANIFNSLDFQKYITGSSAPFYRLVPSREINIIKLFNFEGAGRDFL